MSKTLWKADLADGNYQNPVLFADYSDPDVIRVNDCYYMTASSFNYTPGLPILISKDLVNWRLVNYALPAIPYQRYEIPAHAQGVWAPAIRYHENKFYIYFGMPDEGIFMICTENPLGEWEEPVLVLAGKGLIDPCPFWDEDGKAYLIHGYAKSRIGFKSILGMFPMSWDGRAAIGEDHFIYDGTVTQPTIEGPKVFKRDGRYYILAPAGGVKTGWQTALRSDQITGPYEEKIVMHQGNTPINGPHQGALTDTVSGEEWFVHFQDRGIYGRITHLQPVRWQDGWPVIGSGGGEDGLGEPVLALKKPDTGHYQQPGYLTASDDFTAKQLDLKWQWMGNGKPEFYRLDSRKQQLQLPCLPPVKAGYSALWYRPNVLTQKLIYPYFTAETGLDVTGMEAGSRAGMVMLGGAYLALAAAVVPERYRIIQIESFEQDGEVEEKETVLLELEQKPEQIRMRLWIREAGAEPVFGMAYSVDGQSYLAVNSEFAPSDHTWVGAKIGLFGVTDQRIAKGYAAFEYMKVVPESEE